MVPKRSKISEISQNSWSADYGSLGRENVWNLAAGAAASRRKYIRDKVLD